MRQKLNLITLGVTDFTEAVDFYENGLGWKKSSASVEELAVFPLGGIVLALHRWDALAKDASVDPSGKGFSGIMLSYNAHSEEEVGNVLKKVKRLVQRLSNLPRKFTGEAIADIFKILMAISLRWLTIHSGSRMKMTT